MSAVIDLTDRVFDRLTVIRRDGSNDKGLAVWVCRCSCGGTVRVQGVSLRTGNTTSCGCKVAEFNASGDANRRHGGSSTPEYASWSAMKNRCFNPNCDDYPNYGGCGITVCDRWLDSFEDFLADMGPRPSPKHSIDRFPDPHGNYEPGNCRWATMKQQHNNRRDNRLITMGGLTLCLTAWAERVGLSPQLILYRLKHDWPVADALTTPSRLNAVAAG